MIHKNFSLKNYNTFKIDAKTKYYTEIDNVNSLLELNYNFKTDNYFILGGGSNLLFTKDFDGLIIKFINKDIKITNETPDYINLNVGAGMIWDDFVNHCVVNNYGGVENLSLIPGTVGASAVQNIGAYGAEAKDVITKVYCFDLLNKKNIVLENNDCNFDYRYSVFKEKKKLLITNVEYKLNKKEFNYNIEYGAIEQELTNSEINLKNIRQAVIKIRKSKLPDVEEIGNAGSFFKNPIIDETKFLKIKQRHQDIVFYKLPNKKYKIAAGWLIENAGFKGYTYKNAGVYNKQSLVLINNGNASAEEIIELSNKIIETIFKKYSIMLEQEVIFV